jgi:hypothetical protein
MLWISTECGVSRSLSDLPSSTLMGWCAGASGCTEGLLHSHDSEIAMKSRRDTTGPSPHKVISWMSIGRGLECEGGVADQRPVPRSGRLVRSRIHVPGPRQRNHRGAIALVEHGTLDWDCSRGWPTCAGADLRPATDVPLNQTWFVTREKLPVFAVLTGTGDVVVSSTVKDLVAGSGLVFEHAGEHEFEKGVPCCCSLARRAVDVGPPGRRREGQAPQQEPEVPHEHVPP